MKGFFFFAVLCPDPDPDPIQTGGDWSQRGKPGGNRNPDPSLKGFGQDVFGASGPRPCGALPGESGAQLPPCGCRLRSLWDNIHIIVFFLRNKTESRGGRGGEREVKASTWLLRGELESGVLEKGSSQVKKLGALWTLDESLNRS